MWNAIYFLWFLLFLVAMVTWTKACFGPKSSKSHPNINIHQFKPFSNMMFLGIWEAWNSDVFPLCWYSCCHGNQNTTGIFGSKSSKFHPKINISWFYQLHKCTNAHPYIYSLSAQCFHFTHTILDFSVQLSLLDCQLSFVWISPCSMQFFVRS